MYYQKLGSLAGMNKTTGVFYLVVAFLAIVAVIYCLLNLKNIVYQQANLETTRCLLILAAAAALRLLQDGYKKIFVGRAYERMTKIICIGLFFISIECFLLAIIYFYYEGIDKVVLEPMLQIACGWLILISLTTTCRVIRC